MLLCNVALLVSMAYSRSERLGGGKRLAAKDASHPAFLLPIERLAGLDDAVGVCSLVLI